MGRGITRIRNVDGESVRTFIIDLTSDFEGRKRDVLRERHEMLAEEHIRKDMTFAEKRKAVLHLYMDGLLPVTVSDEYVYDRMNDDDRDELENIMYEVASLDGFDKVLPWRGEEALVTGWHDCGYIIAESKHCMLVIADNENSYVIGCVPTMTRQASDDNVYDDEYDQLSEYAEAELELTRKRAGASYEITGADVEKRTDELLEERQEKEWGEFYEKYRKDANAAMRRVHEFLGTTGLSVPTSAWTSSRIKDFADMTEEERNQYY